MRWPLLVFGFAAVLAGLLVYDYFQPGTRMLTSDAKPRSQQAFIADRIRQAEERSANVRGLYMTSEVANDGGRAAAGLRRGILDLLDATEINAVVIDVKETRGGAVFTERLGELIRVLHARGAWVIARQVVFKDSSQEHTHPRWYLTRAGGAIWRDDRAGSWLDPASPEVWAYQLAVAQAAADAGFDEVQFDYIRFPSDGNVQSIVYPVYDGARPKYEVLREFFRFLHDELRRHRPDLILSADLFGYVALQRRDLGIGQRLEDIGENFNYLSLMVYPSHYYAGFQVAADPVRGLPALFFPYRAGDASLVAANRPYDVVYRSLLIAGDILAGTVATSSPGAATATSTAPVTPPARRAKLRPWLQDFDLGVDSSRGIHYDAAKVRAQIDAAEDAGSSGWLLWSPDNVYTRDALRPKGLNAGDARQ